jgi:hypothetical protein
MHWSAEVLALACSHSPMVPNVQLSWPVAVLRQNGALPVWAAAGGADSIIMAAAATSAFMGWFLFVIGSMSNHRPRGAFRTHKAFVR